jgi:hypothetical protein
MGLPTVDVRMRRRVFDKLLLCHSVFALISGLLGLFLPHVFEWVLIHHGEELRLVGATMNDDQKIGHLALRLFGALVLAQAIIAHGARSMQDAGMRRTLVRAYTVAFGGMALALLRAQLTSGGGLSAWNWLNIVVFLLLTALYGWFAVDELPTFEGLGKVGS